MGDWLTKPLNLAYGITAMYAVPTLPSPCAFGARVDVTSLTCVARVSVRVPRSEVTKLGMTTA